MIALLRMDARALLRDRLAATIFLVGLLAALLAAFAGHNWAERLDEDRAQSIADARIARTDTRAAWLKAPDIPPADAALLPSRASTAILLAPPLLPDFSAGRSAIEPAGATVRLATRPDAMFARYQVENAERLFRGTLDLGFVATVLAPLLLIGLGFGVFVADREVGTARLWLAQAGSPLSLLAARSVTRIGLAFSPILVAGLILLAMGPDPAARANSVALWLAIALLGLLFWWAVILLVNTLPIAAETAALALVGSWTLVVFVLPVFVTAAAGLIDPTPSRFEQIAVARQAEIRANRDFDDDHPDLSSTTLAGRRATVEKGVAVRRSVAEALAPLTRQQSVQMAAQRRLADRLAFVSPPALTAAALAAVARTDRGFYDSQRLAAAGYPVRYGAALVDAALGRRPINATTFDTLPRFVAPAPAAPALGALAWVATLTLLLGCWALARFRRIRLS